MNNTVCPRCGEPVTENQRYCPKCGMPLTFYQEYDKRAYYTNSFLANDAFATGPAGISRGMAAILAIIGGAFP